MLIVIRHGSDALPRGQDHVLGQARHRPARTGEAHGPGLAQKLVHVEKYPAPHEARQLPGGLQMGEVVGQGQHVRVSEHRRVGAQVAAVAAQRLGEGPEVVHQLAQTGRVLHGVEALPHPYLGPIPKPGLA